jgi:gluconate 5-dehydrogenase
MDVAKLFRLEDRVALITGSGRGIGKALAAGFAAAGAKVWVHDKDAALGEQTASELGARFEAADLCCSENIDCLAASIQHQEGRLDILVNNAGIEIVMPFETLDLENLDAIWQVNVRAAIELTQRLLPLLKQSGRASIINVTSIHELMPYPHNAAYSVSKAALSMFTRTIAVELAPYGIRANNLAPGAVMTDMNREVIAEIGADNFQQWIPIGRVAKTEEIVGPALFLASDASSYMTGSTLYVDGGYLQNLVRYRPEG